jgi:hypothetical protein
VFSRRYEKNCLKKVTGRLKTVRKDGAKSEDSSTGQSSAEDRIPQEKELLKIIQERDYKSEKSESLVHVVQDCANDNRNSARRK